MTKLKLFINRPILSCVISIAITLCGLMAVFNMPLSQYPDISPPTIYIWAQYPGASSETIERTVAAQLEAQLNGVPDVLYMNSSSTSSGNVTVILTFEVGTDLNQAINEVLNRVHAATPLLPAIVQKMGIKVAKSSPNFLMTLYFYNNGKGAFDNYYMGNYLKRTLVNDLSLVDGVGKVQFDANLYAMRVWMNLNVMNSLNITPNDIAVAIKEQNNEYTIGKSNSMPVESALLTFNVAGSSMLSSAKQFENIIIRVKGTQVIRLKDLARVELGRQGYDVTPIVSELRNGKVTHNEIAFMEIMLEPSANQLEVRNRVLKQLTEAKRNVPTGLEHQIMFDGSKFVNASIKNVWLSLFDAFILVALVILVFLQNIRASVIALVSVPVSLIGSCAVLYMFGFSLNTLSLFACVLAIGIVVDDAIIVVENIERIKAKVKNFNIKSVVAVSMSELFGAIVAIGLVLSVVFIPVMLLPGMSGVLYRQFAVTIACAVLISAVTALTTTPALCAILLKKPSKHSQFEARFYQFFNKVTDYYMRAATILIDSGKWVLLILLLVIALIIGIFKIIPTSLVPNEDQGFIVGSINIPSSSSLQESRKKSDEIANIILQQKAVERVAEVVGVDFFGGGVNSYATTLFVTLKDWDKRDLNKDSIDKVAMFINMLNLRYKDLKIMAFNLPPIPGLGTTSGVEFYFEGRTISNLADLDAKAKELEAALMKHKEIQSAYHMLDTSTEQIMVNADPLKSKFYGVNVKDVYNTLQYIYSNFNVNFAYKMQGLIWVILQGEYTNRKTLKDMSNMFVKNNKGNLVNIGSLVKENKYRSPLMIERFNDYNATQVIVTPKEGYSSGDIMNIIKTEMSSVAKGYDYEWVGTSFMQKKAQKTSIIALSFAFACVYLVLCALYEMWRLPLVVLMVMPFALVGSGIMLLLRNQPNDLYFQISLVALLGLSAKNIILLIEFGLKNLEHGMNARDAILEALKLRFRPIVMTSITFIVGALPLVYATGAGAGAQHSVGTGIIGGMLGSVILGTLVTPSFFVLIMKNMKNYQPKSD